MADGTAKKRKRATEAPDRHEIGRPSEESSPSGLQAIRVSAVVEPQFSPPVIATTPGLTVPRSVQFNSYVKSRKAPSKRRSNAAVAKDLLLHSSAHSTVDYTGKEERPAGMDSLLRHYLGIFDPATGQLQVVEARKLVIRGTVRPQAPSASVMEEWAARQTATELKNKLSETFGTKKAKKAIRALTENAISLREPGADEASIAEKLDAGELALMESIKEATTNMASREDLQAAVDIAKPVPKGNFDADEIEGVYVPEEIIGAEILNAIPIRDWQKDLGAGHEIQFTSRFVAHRIRRVTIHQDAVKGLRVLRYLYWLISLWQSTMPGSERGTRRFCAREKLRKIMEPAPDVVLESLRHKFSDHGVLRKFHIDLLMTHCCVFASIVDNFELNTFDIREDLKLDLKQVGQYFAEIGAHVRVERSENRAEQIATLTLPLEFPKMRRRRSRR